MNELELDHNESLGSATTEEVLEYWTEGRMDSATPVELPDLSSGTFDTESFDPELFEQEYVRESKFPEGRDLETISQPSAPSRKALTTRIAQPMAIPYVFVGKVFMTFGDRSYVGSGWATATSGVFTAAHCLYNHKTKSWARNILFVPAYIEGQAPLGKWVGVESVAASEWTKKKNFAFDLGVFRVNRPIAPTAGSLGYRVRTDIITPFTSVGYPAEHPYNGRSMWQSTGHLEMGHRGIKWMYNDLNGGCSGGPWIVWADGRPYAHGLNSFTRSDKKGRMFSPWFSVCVKQLNDIAENW